MQRRFVHARVVSKRKCRASEAAESIRELLAQVANGGIAAAPRMPCPPLFAHRLLLRMHMQTSSIGHHEAESLHRAAEALDGLVQAKADGAPPGASTQAGAGATDGRDTPDPAQQPAQATAGPEAQKQAGTKAGRGEARAELETEAAAPDEASKLKKKKRKKGERPCA